MAASQARDSELKLTFEQFLALPVPLPVHGYSMLPVGALERIYAFEFTKEEKEAAGSQDPSGTLARIYTALCELGNDYRVGSENYVGPGKFTATQKAIGDKCNVERKMVNRHLPLLEKTELLAVWGDTGKKFYGLLAVPGRPLAPNPREKSAVPGKDSPVLNGDTLSLAVGAPKDTPYIKEGEEVQTTNAYNENAFSGGGTGGGAFDAGHMFKGFPEWLPKEVPDFPELVGYEDFAENYRFWRTVVRNAGQISIAFKNGKPPKKGKLLFIECCEEHRYQVKLVRQGRRVMDNFAACFITKWQIASGQKPHYDGWRRVAMPASTPVKIPASATRSTA